jgi:glutamine synthetase
MEIEANLMVELFRTQLLPAALCDQKRRTQAIKNLVDLGADVEGLLSATKKYASFLESAIYAVDEIEKVQHQSVDFGWEIRGKSYAEILGPKMQEARMAVDRLEGLVDNTLWPLPKYREMLFVS